MKTWALVAVIALLVASSGPDFSWGKSKAVRETLAASRAAWESAISARSYPTPKPSGAAFDEERLREIIRRKDLPGVAYQLLDTALDKEKSLGQARDLYRKAVTAAGPSKAAKTALGGFDQSYHLARSRTRLAAGMARAAVARKMAAEGNSAYAFQAMESAIDALRDAAEEATKLPDGTKRAEQIRALRSALFSVWDAAERSKDLRLLSALDLAKEYDRAVPVVEKRSDLP